MWLGAGSTSGTAPPQTIYAIICAWFGFGAFIFDLANTIFECCIRLLTVPIYLIAAAMLFAAGIVRTLLMIPLDFSAPDRLLTWRQWNAKTLGVRSIDGEDFNRNNAIIQGAPYNSDAILEQRHLRAIIATCLLFIVTLLFVANVLVNANRSYLRRDFGPASNRNRHRRGVTPDDATPDDATPDTNGPRGEGSVASEGTKADSNV
jgi:hypothetical protein